MVLYNVIGSTWKTFPADITNLHTKSMRTNCEIRVNDQLIDEQGCSSVNASNCITVNAFYTAE